MIEQVMVGRMIVRGLVLAPLVIGSLWLVGGAQYGVSAGAGIAMTLLNLYLSARIIGGVAERAPRLLMAAAMIALALGLALLTAAAMALRALDLVYFPVTGFVLIAAHLALVLWEAPGAYRRLDNSKATSVPTAVHTRS